MAANKTSLKAQKKQARKWRPPSLAPLRGMSEQVVNRDK